MYISLIVGFIFLLCIVIASLQNGMPMELRFLLWEFKSSITELIAYSSLLGAAIVAVLALPRLASKSLRVRKLNKEIARLQKRTLEAEHEKEGEGKEGEA